MPRTTSHRSPFRFLFGILLVLVLAAGGFGGYLYVSAQKTQGHINAATTAYDQYLEQLNQQQYTEALSSLHTTADEVALIRQSLDGWQWELAEKVPYLSEDISCARSSASIADELSNNALLPVIEQVEGILGDVSSNDPLTGIPNAFSKLPDLYTTLAEARPIVATCKSKADALPTSHFDEVNEWANLIKTATADTEEVFAQLDVIFSAMDTLGEFANSISTPTTTTTAG